MKAVVGSQNNADLVKDLRKGAALLDEIHIKFRQNFAAIKYCRVVSFYEGHASNTIEVRINAGILCSLLKIEVRCPKVVNGQPLVHL